MNIGCSAVLIVVLGCVLVTAEDCYIPMWCNNVPSWGKLPGNIQTGNVVGSEVCERQINKLNDNIANLTERAAALEKYFDDLEKQHQYNITKDATTRNSNITLSPQPGKNTFAEIDNNTTTALRGIDETTTDASTTGEANLLFYNGKEFIVLVDKIRYMVDAEQECKDRGGELANIYDQINMDRIMKYIREDIMADNDTIKDFMLGMTYLNTMGQLYLQNGSAISESNFAWVIGTPYTEIQCKGCTSMILRVHKNETDVNNQHFYNNPDQQIYALCEKDIE